MSETNGNGHAAASKGPVIPTKDSMRAALPKRFYKAVTITPASGGAGWRVALDGRPVKTPGKNDLTLPAEALAEAVAAEWRAQGAEIDPATMPVTRIVNSAIDGVATRRAEVAAEVVKYAGSDLICYRADAPPGLVAAQAKRWDPVLAWAESALGARFKVAEGIIHIAQPEAATAAVAKAVEPLQPIPLAALHVITTLTGSALLALAHARGRLSAEAAWEVAHVDEDWQISLWGEDAEATERRAKRWLEMQAAAKVLALSAG